MRAVLLVPGEAPLEVDAPIPTPLEWVTTMLGCRYIESVPMHALPPSPSAVFPAFGFCDEEARLSGREPNPAASVLSGIGAMLLGAVIVFGGVDDDGEPVGLTDNQFAIAMGHAPEPGA